MKKINLFLSLGAILLSTIACDSELDLDKDLKFSKLPVEQQKQKIEENGIQLIEAMEGILETEAVIAMTNMYSLSESEVYTAPMQRLVRDIKKNNVKAFSNFDKQMRVSYIDSENWAEYSYNFQTGEMDKIRSLNNKMIINFPADADATQNNAVITINYKESTVMIPESDEPYPSEITFKMTVNSKEVMSADFKGKYYNDGSPEEVTQSLNIDNYSWKAEVTNNKKKASESFEFKKGKTIILKSVAELNGKLTEEQLQTAFENETPENAIESFAVLFQVMDIAIKGGTTNFKKLVTDIRNVNDNYSNLSDKQYAEEMVRILNKNLICTAFFVEENRKFADVEMYVEEVTEGKYTYYSPTPRFVLSDGSKVSAEEFVQTGFENLIDRIEEMFETIETYEPNIVPVETY